MVVCNLEFKRTPKYEEILDKLSRGLNIYLCGGARNGKSTLVKELQYDLVMKYCYVSIPSKINYDTLNEICKWLVEQLNIEVDTKCFDGVFSEGTLTAIKEIGKKILFVFDEVDNIVHTHPDIADDINEWLHDLCLIDGCQVICVGQYSLNKSLPLFFVNKSWHQLFDVVNADVEKTTVCESIKSTMQSWYESEVARGEYPETLLKLILMGVVGEMSLCDAVKAASVFC